MEMHQVWYFLALCEELNFTRAAKRCGVAQPSLTNAIKTLESELQGALFERSPAVQLTILGEIIRPLLETIARCADEAKRCAGQKRCTYQMNGKHVPAEAVAHAGSDPAAPAVIRTEPLARV